MEIKHLRADDYDALIALWQRSDLASLRPQGRDSREAFVRQLASGVQTALGLKKDGQLVGAVVATHDGRKGWINRLVVNPDHRRQGYAKQLIAAAEAVLRAQDIHVFAALIEGENEPSQELFVGQGYELGECIRYLSKRDDVKT